MDSLKDLINTVHSLRIHLLLALFLWLSFPAAIIADNHQPPPDTQIRLPVTRDTWVSSVKGEQNANLGGADRLKTKGIQEFALVDLDPQILRGRVINSATLHLHCCSKAPLRRVTVSTLASDWVEGTATRYRKQIGSASFNWAAQNQKPWAWPGSDITAVINGQGNTLWRFADASPPDQGGWQKIAVAPAVAAARVAGLSYGFTVFDDVGNEYQRDGEKIVFFPMRNRFVSSREAGTERAPYFTIHLGEKDLSAPGPVTKIRNNTAGLAAGESLITWKTPADIGSAGTLGFQVRITDAETFAWDAATPVPRYLVPIAGQPDESVTMHLRDLKLPTNQPINIGIRAVDGAGNVGPVHTAKVTLAGPGPQLVLPAPPPIPTANQTDRLPTLGDLKIFIIDPLDKVDPISGEILPTHDTNYHLANHLWSAANRQIRLFAARNETVAFQVIAEGKTEGLRASVSFTGKGTPTPQPEILSFHYVKGKNGRMLPDPLVPFDEPLKIPFADERLTNQTNAAFIVDIHVPKTAHPGSHTGKLAITTKDGTLTLNIALNVWNFTLPDTLSFIPQMNGYGRVPEPDHELAYYRLAQRHRTCLNILPYGWTGRIADNRAPKWDGDNFNWDAYDQRFGHLLDGSAFADLPRGPIPVEAFYLPLNENWPINIHEAFTGGYWIEDALRPKYRKDFVAATRKFAEHLQAKGWNKTMFEFYLNNKISHKQNQWKGSSAPWVFDEPVNTQDFWALRWYGSAFHEGVGQGSRPVQLLFRADISRPQWQRDLLDGILDVNVVGGAYRRYQRLVLDRKLRWEEVTYTYGSPNLIEQSNAQPAGWCIETWCLGLDGVVPWQTLGKPRSWTGSDQNALFYPGAAVGRPGPLPSIRLKSFRRGQQDVEYLTILSATSGMSRRDVGEMVLKKLHLEGEFSHKSAADAGQVSFRDLSPVDLWHLRTAIGYYLNEQSVPEKPTTTSTL